MDFTLVSEPVIKTQMFYTAVFAMLVYDFFANIWREYSYIWQAQWSLIKILYIWVRYSCIGVATFTMVSYYGSWSESRCSTFVRLQAALPILQILPAHGILAVRMYAMWNRSKVILFVIALPLMALEAGIMAWVAWHEVEPMLGGEGSGPCLPISHSKAGIVYYVMPMIVDLVLTGLTTWQCLRVQTMSKGLSGSGLTGLTSSILAQSLQYYFLITACNIGNCIWYATQSKLNSLVGPLALNVRELMALHLCLAFKSDVYVDPTAPVSSSMDKRTNRWPDASTDVNVYELYSPHD